MIKKDTYRVGIDLGGTRIKIGLVSNRKLADNSMIKATQNNILREHLPLIENEITRLCKRNPNAEITSIGLAFPGLVDTDQNRVMDTSSKYTDAVSIDFTDWAKQRFGVRFRMDNDARLACLGEWQCGAGRGVENMVMLTLGTGIGTAVVLDNRLLHGKHFQAGILGGHMVIDYKDRTHKCSCGKYGCLEAIASMWMIKDLAMQHPLFHKSPLAGVDRIDWETIGALSAQGDALSILLQRHCLDAWSAGLVNLIHAYDPERVVIGGGVIHDADVLLPYFRKNVKELAWCPGGFPDICAADFPDAAAIMGAAELFESENLV